MSNVRQFPNQQPPRPEAHYSSEVSAAIADAIWGLFNKLPPEDKDALVSQLLKAARPLIPASRSGDVLATVARFLPKRRDWTAEQIRQEVSAAGITASSREVFNAIGYLIRKGHVVRKGGGSYEMSGGVGYGQPREDGSIVTSAYDLGGGTVRNSEQYDD
jgi:hypothetical protein